MKNEMPSQLLDEKLCFIRFPPHTLQNFGQKKNHSHHHQGSFFHSCEVSGLVNLPEEILAKFGYKSERSQNIRKY
jgi:hypothetical protein